MGNQYYRLCHLVSFFGPFVGGYNLLLASYRLDGPISALYLNYKASPRAYKPSKNIYVEFVM